MLSHLLPRLMGTASFGLGVLYAAVLAGSLLTHGVLVYWALGTSLAQPLTARIDAEMQRIREELRGDADSELIEEIQRRNNVLGLEYLRRDAKGTSIAGSMPVLSPASGWSTAELPINRSGAGAQRT